MLSQEQSYSLLEEKKTVDLPATKSTLFSKLLQALCLVALLIATGGLFEAGFLYGRSFEFDIKDVLTPPGDIPTFFSYNRSFSNAPAAIPEQDIWLSMYPPGPQSFFISPYNESQRVGFAMWVRYSPIQAFLFSLSLTSLTASAPLSCKWKPSVYFYLL